MPTPRVPENCTFRVPKDDATEGATHHCSLAQRFIGITDEAFCLVRRDECEACCKQRVPRDGWPNAMVASLIFGNLRRIKEQGGIEGCDAARAEALMPRALQHLLVIKTAPDNTPVVQPEPRLPYTGPCRSLGQQTGERTCATCRGNVRQKTFACHHPLHGEPTTILECRVCQDYEPGARRRQVERWVIGITTAKREPSTLRNTLESLRAAGWKEMVHLFAEHDAPVEAHELGPITVVRRAAPSIGAWSNFHLALSELYQREPRADAYFLAQDDADLAKNLRPYLESKLWPGANPGVVSLHTASHLAAPNGTGFFQADLGWSAWGAQALVFSNSAARALLTDSKVMDHRLKGMLDGQKNVDSVIGDWCRRTGREFWLHAPSLVEHTGAVSTLWPGVKLAGRRLSADFPGSSEDLHQQLEKHRQNHGSQPPARITMLDDGILQRHESSPEPELTNPDSASTQESLSLPGVSIAVVITAHAAYLPLLPECLAAWDEQLPQRKILVLDGCDYVAPAGWEIIRGDWQHPGPARNAGIAVCDLQTWIIHWDADNVPAPDFLSLAKQAAANSGETIGVIYSDIAKESPTETARVITDDTLGDPRESFFVDTASVWRRDALLHIGGWAIDSRKLDDWDMSCRMRALGWQFQRLGATVALREHSQRRTHSAKTTDAVWQLRPMGIITLFAGRTEMLSHWKESLTSMELPPHCGLTVVDSSGSAEFRSALDEVLSNLPRNIQRLTRIEVPQTKKPGSYETIHHLVGRLYGIAIAATPEPALLTWEDDVFPASPSALRSLSDRLQPKAGVAAVSAAYPSRSNRSVAVASMNPELWSRMPSFDWLGVDVRPVGMVGGGFTLWSRAALEQCPILGGFTLPSGVHLGWDGFVCRRLSAARWQILLHGGVQCAHLCGDGSKE